MNDTIIERSSLSFHALRAKFQLNHHSDHSKRHYHHVITNEPSTSVDLLTMKKKNSNNTMPRRITSVAKNMSDLSDHFSLKRNYHTSSTTDLPTSKTTPSLWSSSNSSSSTTVQDEDEEDDDDEPIINPNASLNHSNSTLDICCTVPRTGSFVTELSKRLEISEKKGEPVSQIIPSSNKDIMIAMRKSAPVLHLEDSPSMLVLPPPPLPVQHYNNTKNRKSVPTSASSPSLNIPSSIKRSTTGTSVHSIASSSHSSISTSQSTISSNKRNNWYFAHWFSHPPLPTSSIKTANTSSVTLATTTIETSKPSTTKRARVIQELITTEKLYQADMELVKEIYYDYAYEAFSKYEIKYIFINLLEIISFEKDFVHLLEESIQEDNITTIGTSFSFMMSRMDKIYSDYCKKHEDAVSKIQELRHRPNVQTFFSNCKEKINGRTTCWDLSSLLIKPVQRVLKYPLLLKEIVTSTSEDHPDYEQLLIATRDIQNMADHINEIKRRKDMVEQLINDKKKMDRNVVQNINKKFARRAHRKKQQALKNDTRDTLFDDLYRQFELRQEMARQFEKGVQEWVSKVKDNVRALSDLVQSLEALYYGDSNGIGLRTIGAFKQLVSQLDSNSVETHIQESVYNRLEDYSKLFKNPSQIIQKRNRKLADYDRVRHIISKGEVPDKQLQISAEQYVSLNAYLLDELPTFLSLTQTYFDIILGEYARVQSLYWRKSKLEWKTLTTEQPLFSGREQNTWPSLENDYLNAMRRLEPRIKEITTCQSTTNQQVSSTTITNTNLDEPDNISFLTTTAEPAVVNEEKKKEDAAPTIQLSSSSNNSKYDSLFSESQPVFQCKALTDYETPEKLKVRQGDIIQIWLPTSGMAITTSSDSATTNTESTAIQPTEWWYGSLLATSNNTDTEQTYGWLPSTVCEKI